MNNGDLNEEFGDVIHNTILEVQMSVGESRELFIFRTIKPFCEEVLSREISKKELKEMLLKAERMKWIPCSERLPKKPECGVNGYIVQKKRVAEPFSAYWDGERWTNEDDDVIDEVIAWSPLHEPYKE